MNRRDLLLGATAFAVPHLVGVQTSSAVPRSESAGLVADLKGAAEAELQGARRALKSREAVYIGDLLSTAEQSRLLLQLGSATTIRLGAVAKFKVEKWLADIGGEFELGAGIMMFERTGKPANGTIDFRSPYGLIAVRGTSFYAGPSRGSFGVLVESGQVLVTAGGRTVTLGPRQGTDIKTPGAPPSAPRKWNTARVREIQAAVR